MSVSKNPKKNWEGGGGTLEREFVYLSGDHLPFLNGAGF